MVNETPNWLFFALIIVTLLAIALLAVRTAQWRSSMSDVVILKNNNLVLNETLQAKSILVEEQKALSNVLRNQTELLQSIISDTNRNVAKALLSIVEKAKSDKKSELSLTDLTEEIEKWNELAKKTLAEYKVPDSEVESSKSNKS